MEISHGQFNLYQKMERVAFIINPFSAKKEYKPFVNDLEKE